MSRIEERPSPPEPLGTAGGVKPGAACGRQAKSDASAGDGNASDQAMAVLATSHLECGVAWVATCGGRKASHRYAKTKVCRDGKGNTVSVLESAVSCAPLLDVVLSE